MAKLLSLSFRDHSRNPLCQAVNACVMRDEARQVAFGRPALEPSEAQIRFRKRLFSRIVPTVRDIGAWSDKVQKACTDPGGMQYANTNAQEMLDNDAKVGEEFDRKMRDGFGATAGPGK